LLEGAIVLEVILHKYSEAAIIAGLLIFNAALAYFQENHAQATLTALKSRLALNASVRRDGNWKTVPATGLVRGDLVKLSLGAVVAADVHLVSGSILLDQSMLTGESLPIEAGPGIDTCAGALIRRGEATAVVTATGIHTKFGKTVELVRTAHVVSSQQKAVLRITSILAAIPVALPATFTLAAALGARALAKVGVLPAPFPSAFHHRILRSSRAFFPKANTASSKHFKKTGTRWGCAEMAQTMLPRFVRHKSGSPYRPQRMSPNPRRALF